MHQVLLVYHIFIFSSLPLISCQLLSSNKYLLLANFDTRLNDALIPISFFFFYGNMNDALIFRLYVRIQQFPHAYTCNVQTRNRSIEFLYCAHSAFPCRDVNGPLVTGYSKVSTRRSIYGLSCRSN